MHHTLTVILATHYPPKDSWFNWFFGPQMLGIIFLIIGSIQYRYPPKSINNWYGYRTDTSKRNQETWDEAQRYSSLFMAKGGLFLIVIGFLVVAALNLSPLSEKIRFAVMMPIFFASTVTTVILMLARTEKHLKGKFGDK